MTILYIHDWLYIGINDYLMLDVYVTNGTLHLHLGIISIQFSCPLHLKHGPTQESINQCLDGEDVKGH